MAETDFTSDVTAENGNNLEEEETQEEPNPERKFWSMIGMTWYWVKCFLTIKYNTGNHKYII